MESFTVPITNDSLDEDDEEFYVTLSSPSGCSATLGTPSKATVIIEDNDAPPTVQFSASSYSVNEDGKKATVTATLSGPAARR